MPYGIQDYDGFLIVRNRTILGVLLPEEQSGSAGVQAPGVPTVRDMDIVYQEVERLYYEISKGCGLSETAYWILVDIVVAGGSCPQGSIATCHSRSRQTVSSALRLLVTRGLATLERDENNRRSKIVTLTSEGRAFCEREVSPALQAEQRAFDSLSPRDRADLVALVRRYVVAIDLEMQALHMDGPAASGLSNGPAASGPAESAGEARPNVR